MVIRMRGGHGAGGFLFCLVRMRGRQSAVACGLTRVRAAAVCAAALAVVRC